MKRLAKVFSIFLTLFLLILVPLGCGDNYPVDGGMPYTPATMPAWSTKYTEQEHWDRAYEEIRLYESRCQNPVLEVYFETVYSYWTEDPEYILITLYHKNYYEGSFERDGVTYEYKTRYSHTIVQIRNDKYLCAFLYNRIHYEEKTGMQARFCYGINPYELCGYKYYKKYYTGKSTLAVRTNDGIKKIYNVQTPDVATDWDYDFLDVAPRNEERFIQRMEIMEPARLKYLLYESRYYAYDLKSSFMNYQYK